MVQAWLMANMLSNSADPTAAARAVVEKLMDYEGTTEHAHHFMIDKCRDAGLNVVAIEGDQSLQEDVLSVHHSFIATFAQKPVLKVIQNAAGATWAINT